MTKNRTARMGVVSAFLALPLLAALASAGRRPETRAAQAAEPDVESRANDIQRGYLGQVDARKEYMGTQGARAFGAFYESEMRAQEELFYALVYYAQTDARAYPEAAQRYLDRASALAAKLKAQFGGFVQREEERAKREQAQQEPRPSEIPRSDPRRPQD
ncbi:MAG: hypothetical protein HY552_03400 [Elusimicrobia bacterium]|nr:hypothetical protein [Elusimicrobiota bacterium]